MIILSQEQQELIHTILQQVYGYLEALSQECNVLYTQPGEDELNTSVLAQRLTALVEYVEGIRIMGQTELEVSIDHLQRMLFASPLSPTYRLPMGFHKTPLGNLINSARIRATWLTDALSVADAARLLDIARPTVYNWIDNGFLQPIWVNSHPLIPRSQILMRGTRAAKKN